MPPAAQLARKPYPISQRSVSSQLFSPDCGSVTLETKTFHGETSEPSNLPRQILSLTISATCNRRAFLILWLLACISVLGSLRLSWCVVCLTSRDPVDLGS